MEDFLEMLTYYITYPKINRIIRVTLLSILFVALLVIGMKWINMPIDLKAYVVKDTAIYVNQKLEASDFCGVLRSVSGSEQVVRKPKFDFVKDEDTGDFLVTVYAGGLFDTIKVIPIGVKSVTANYVGPTLYANAIVTKDQIRVSVEFENGRRVESVPFECQLPNVGIVEYMEIPVSTEYGDTTLVLAPVGVNVIDVVYHDSEDSPLCVGDLFDQSKVTVSVNFGDGNVRELPNFTVRTDAQHYVMGDETLRVMTSYGEGLLHLSPMPLIEQTVEYKSKIFEKDALDPSAVELTQTFGWDGVVSYTRKITDWTLDGYGTNRRPVLTDGVDIVFVTPIAKTKFHPDIVSLVDVKMYQKDGKPLFVDDIPAPDYFEISYSDGTVVTVNAKDVNMDESRWSEPVREGLNSRDFLYYAKTYTVKMYALKELPVQKAKETNVNEIDNAEAKYVSDNMIVTISSGNIDGMVYKLAHVIINSPLQIKGGLSNDVYGGTRETPTSASQRQNWIIGINASVFDYDTGGLDTSVVGAIIKNHEVMEDSGAVTTGQEILLLDDGVIMTPDANVEIDKLREMYSVKDSFGSRDVVLIAGGMRMNEDIVSDSIPRTAIGMVRPGEYYLLVASSDGYSGGGTYYQVRELLWSVGCVYAKCLDGGSSSSMVFNGNLVNTPASGVERAVSDYLYFTDISEDTTLSTLDYFQDTLNDYSQFDYSLYGYDDVGDGYVDESGNTYSNDAVVIIG